jgi:precorrin-3B C17-methyltransferase
MKKIYIVGIGPGSYEQMTIKAAKTLELCDTIVGYQVYVELVRPYFPDKEFLSTPMTKEVDRCRMCFEEALKGKQVAMICSGDAGVYGMAGLMEFIGKDYPDVELEIVSGVTAALAGAAVLGAPLVQDFAVISLSDLLTPWEKIEKRILAAASADLVICLYNPSSKKRYDFLQKACDLILQYADENTVCGIVENIGREGETSAICSLKELREISVSMFTTVFVGNSQTEVVNGKMVTPRGYRV